jgi:predicted nucleic acid-binding protein
VKLFLDTSALLAASGSSLGASRAIFDLGAGQHWELMTSLYCVEETNRNLGKLPSAATGEWRNRLQPRLIVIRETLVRDRPLLFIKTKDKPILLTALAERCDVLLTLDHRDFSGFLDTQVYRLWIRTPASFLTYERDQGRLAL